MIFLFKQVIFRFHVNFPGFRPCWLLCFFKNLPGNAKSTHCCCLPQNCQEQESLQANSCCWAAATKQSTKVEGLIYGKLQWIVHIQCIYIERERELYICIYIYDAYINMCVRCICNHMYIYDAYVCI